MCTAASEHGGGVDSSVPGVPQPALVGFHLLVVAVHHYHCLRCQECTGAATQTHNSEVRP